METSEEHDQCSNKEVPADWLSFKDQVNKLAQVLEKMNLSEYISYLNSPRRMLLINFASGLIRGLGVALGATILAGIAFIILRRLVFLNLPVIGGVIAELVKIVNAHNGY